MKIKRSAATAAVAVFLVALVSQASASTWNFSWSGWHGGTHDSSTWSASKSGDHGWVNVSCHADAPVSGGQYKVEIRRDRSFLPDVSLGIKTYGCNGNLQNKKFNSGGSGEHKFRFPWVEKGTIGISGKGRVNYP